MTHSKIREHGAILVPGSDFDPPGAQASGVGCKEVFSL